MKQIIKHGTLIFFLTVPILQLHGINPVELNRSFIQAAQKSKKSVVNIIIYKKNYKNDKPVYTKVAYGSGTIIAANDRYAYIVTNNHVVKKGNNYQILLHDGTECRTAPFSERREYLSDDKTDLAVLRIRNDKAMRLIPIDIGDSNSLKEGEWVLAIGNPYGLKQSVTSGIVSSKGRNDMGYADIEDFIQTDVPINPGNSGGPLINLKGEMVGINTAIRTVSGGYQGISFAIPSNIVKQVCIELINYGRVRRGWIGFITREKESEGNRGNKKVVEVISVIKDSPADRAGMKKSDIIYGVNGQKIKSLSHLIRSIANKPVGSTLDIQVLRQGRIHEFIIVLREKWRHKKIHRGTRQMLSRYGMELDENVISEDLVISYLRPMGVAYQKGLKKGDVIVSLNGKPVSSLDTFLQALGKDNSNIESMEILRGTRLYTIRFSD